MCDIPVEDCVERLTRGMLTDVFTAPLMLTTTSLDGDGTTPGKARKRCEMTTPQTKHMIESADLALSDRDDMEIQFEQVAGTTALIIDNIYRNPDHVRGLALSLNFHREAGAYPGFFAFVSISTRAMLDLVNTLMREHIGADLAFTPFYQDDLAFAVVTKRGDELKPGQRQPHCDGFCAYAGLVYLNPAEQCFGGTSFWRHRATGLELALESEDPVPVIARFGLSGAAAPGTSPADKRAAEAGTGYLIASNDSWEMTQVIAMKSNRFVLYSSNIFHSPLYDERDFGTTLRSRRLTQNFYFNRAS